MLEQIKQKLQQEDTQRAILQVVGATAVFVTSYAVNKALNAGMMAGVEKIMERLHPTTEVPTE